MGCHPERSRFSGGAKDLPHFGPKLVVAGPNSRAMKLAVQIIANTGEFPGLP
jgi:hypothetical protein